MMLQETILLQIQTVVSKLKLHTIQPINMPILYQSEEVRLQDQFTTQQVKPMTSIRDFQQPQLMPMAEQLQWHMIQLEDQHR